MKASGDTAADINCSRTTSYINTPELGDSLLFKTSQTYGKPIVFKGVEKQSQFTRKTT